MSDTNTAAPYREPTLTPPVAPPREWYVCGDIDGIMGVTAFVGAAGAVIVAVWLAVCFLAWTWIAPGAFWWIAKVGARFWLLWCVAFVRYGRRT